MRCNFRITQFVEFSGAFGCLDVHNCYNLTCFEHDPDRRRLRLEFEGNAFSIKGQPQTFELVLADIDLLEVTGLPENLSELVIHEIGFLGHEDRDYQWVLTEGEPNEDKHLVFKGDVEGAETVIRISAGSATITTLKASEPSLSPKAKHENLRLRARLRALYHGASPAAVRFRYAVILIDFLIIAFFIAAPAMRDHGLTFYVIDYAVAAFLALDMGARAIAHGDIKAWLKKPIVWVDLFVLATLLFPAWLLNLGFLRVVRLWTLVHSEFFWRTVGRRYDDTRVEDIARAGASLLTFVFVVTGFVYSSFVGRYEGVSGYVDALYFTVTSLTTTGYGDITLPGVWGKLLSMAVMLGGVSLFIGLIQSILRPHKVTYQCHDCGLRRHDPDAVHCKACGKLLNIPDDGV